jgi:O-antigen/teichoic acid export membrane protein
VFSRELARNSALLTLGSIFSAAFSAVSTIVLTRLVSPKEFGVYIVCLTVASVVAPAVILRLDMASLSVTSRKRAREIFLIGLVCLPITGVLGSALVVSFLLNISDLDTNVYLLGLAVAVLLVASGLAQLAKTNAIWGERIAQASLATGLDSVIRNVSQLALAVGQFGGRTFILADAAGKACMAAVLWPPYKITGRRLRTAFRNAFKRLRAYKSYVIYGVPSSLLDTLAAMMLVPLVASMYSTADAGLVGLAARVLSLPAALLSSNYGDLIQRRLVEKLGADNHSRQVAVLSLFGVALLFALIATIPVAVLLIFFASDIFGNGWAGVVTVVPWLAALSIISATMSPVSRWIFVVGAQRAKFFYDCIAVTMPALFFYFVSVKPIEVAVGAYVLGHFISYLIYLLVILVAVRRFVPTASHSSTNDLTGSRP